MVSPCLPPNHQKWRNSRYISHDTAAFIPLESSSIKPSIHSPFRKQKQKPKTSIHGNHYDDEQQKKRSYDDVGNGDTGGVRRPELGESVRSAVCDKGLHAAVHEDRNRKSECLSQSLWWVLPSNCWTWRFSRCLGYPNLNNPPFFTISRLRDLTFQTFCLLILSYLCVFQFLAVA